MTKPRPGKRPLKGPRPSQSRAPSPAQSRAKFQAGGRLPQGKGLAPAWPVRTIQRGQPVQPVHIDATASPPETGAGPFKSGYVALIGCPNVGKSSLLNQILKEKVSIVSATPQTTRSKIIGIRHFPAAADAPAAQIIFLDTPGLHRPLGHRLNQRMVQTAKAALQEADIVLFVIDATHKPPLPGSGRRDDEGAILELLSSVRCPVFLLLNKIDLINKGRLLPVIDAYRRVHPFELFLPVSAKTGDGIEPLLAALVQRLPDTVPYYPTTQSSDQPVLFRAAELIREKVLHHTRQEVPHAVAVVIEEYTEPPADRPRAATRIRARVIVERESQKAILIGKGGQMLKTIGTEARQELEPLVGRSVFLALWVSVKEAWRQDEQFLTEVGY
ncbi:MAG: GTPase Era [Nitrospirae bacterium]|nr:GTPase Era [Nitrospirota bacterium]